MSHFVSLDNPWIIARLVTTSSAFLIYLVLVGLAYHDVQRISEPLATTSEWEAISGAPQGALVISLVLLAQVFNALYAATIQTVLVVPQVTNLGVALLLLGYGAYALYRRRKGLRVLIGLNHAPGMVGAGERDLDTEKEQ